MRCRGQRARTHILMLVVSVFILSGVALAPSFTPIAEAAYTPTAGSPQLLMLSHKSGVPGSKVTLIGRGFGLRRGESYVAFGAEHAVTYLSWGPNCIVCRVPQLSGGRFAVTVVAGRGASRPFPFLVRLTRPLIAGGGYHSLAIRGDGSLWSWGFNDLGQLGLGDSLDRHVPTQIGADSDWVRVSAGDRHSLALKNDGSLWSWGYNNCGQLGLGDPSLDRSTPTRVGADTDWSAVACGQSHTVALKVDGSLWTWGLNYFGQLGLGDASFKQSAPTRVGVDSDWTAVACGPAATFAIKRDGSLWAWGLNQHGQLGQGDTVNRGAPVRVGTDSDWMAIAAGWSHVLALKRDHGLWAWGNNQYGQLGLGDTVDRLNAVRVGADLDWTGLACGGYWTLGTKADGGLWAWGNNLYGQLGLGDTSNRLEPNRVGTDTDWSDVSCGFLNSIAVKGDGSVWAGGFNSVGQLGLGDTTDRWTPTMISWP